MVISFEALPAHLKLQCLHKTEFTDFVRFKQSSSFALQFSKQIKRSIYGEWDRWDIHNAEISFIRKGNTGDYQTRPFWKLKDEPIRFHFELILIWGDLTDELCEFIVNEMSTKRWKCKKISIEKVEDMTCSPENFNKLVETSKITEFSNHIVAQQIDPSYLQQPAVQKIESAFHCASLVNDDDFLELSAIDIRGNFSNLTRTGINGVLKQWISGIRRIKFLLILQGFSEEDDDIIFSGINHERIHPCRRHPKQVGYCTGRVFGITRNDRSKLIVSINSQCLKMGIVRSFDHFHEAFAKIGEW